MKREVVVGLLVIVFCLSVVSSQSACEIEFASWKSQAGDRIDITDILEGDEVFMYLYGTKGCEGLEVSFEIFEDDFGLEDDSVKQNPENAFFFDGIAKGMWVAEYQSDSLGKPEYYFRANVQETSTTATSIHGLNAILDRGEELVVEKCDEICRGLGSCEGIADSCFDVGGSLIPQEIEDKDNNLFYQLCLNQKGCSWIYNEDYGLYECKGNPKLISCDEFSDRLGCVNQRGCKWVRGEDCELVSAYWNATSVIDGEEVELIVKGVNCNGQELKIEIFENDATGAGGEEKALDEPLHVFFERNIAVGVWKAEWQDDYEEYTSTGTYLDGTTVTTYETEQNPPEYFFIADLVGEWSETIRGGFGCGLKIVLPGFKVPYCSGEDTREGLYVYKKGWCVGNLPEVECPKYPSVPYCELIYGCMSGKKEEGCIKAKCSDFNQREWCENHEDCSWLNQ